jgi:hypothetical protein
MTYTIECMISWNYSSSCVDRATRCILRLLSGRYMIRQNTVQAKTVQTAHMSIPNNIKMILPAAPYCIVFGKTLTFHPKVNYNTFKRNLFMYANRFPEYLIEFLRRINAASVTLKNSIGNIYYDFDSICYETRNWKET